MDRPRATSTCQHVYKTRVNINPPRQHKSATGEPLAIRINLTDKEREARSCRARGSTLERLGPVTASWKHLGASCERLGAFQSILGASCERLGAFQSILGASC